MRSQVFTVVIKTKERDGCGNYIKPLSEGDIRNAIMNGLDNYDSVVVAYGYNADI